MLQSTMKVRKTIDIEVPGLGSRIREARKRDPRSLREISQQAGMTAANWYAVENEEIKALPLETLRSIEEALDISLGIIFD